MFIRRKRKNNFSLRYHRQHRWLRICAIKMNFRLCRNPLSRRESSARGGGGGRREASRNRMALIYFLSNHYCRLVFRLLRDIGKHQVCLIRSAGMSDALSLLHSDKHAASSSASSSACHASNRALLIRTHIRTMTDLRRFQSPTFLHSPQKEMRAGKHQYKMINL